jgi:S-layer family protein
MLGRSSRFTTALFLLGAALAVTAAAEPPNPVHLPVRQAPPGYGAATEPKSRPEYGTTGLTYVEVGGAAFTPMNSSAVYTTSGDGYHDQILRSATGNFVDFTAPIHLPSGAIVKYLELDYCDTTGGSGFVQGALVETNFVGNATNYVGFLVSQGDGCTLKSVDATSDNMVINNYTRHYWLLATMSDSPGDLVGLSGMVVGYQLQVSPAPGVATFNDVPTSHPFFQFVEALVDSGITAGCGNNNYCPDAPLTRGQMAVFLSKALGLNFH